jgi:pilus assembly protein FimV
MHAAGLGKLTLNSALGQPLNAEIDIVTANRDEISSLKASIATREAFAQAGINYEPNFSTIKISVESRVNGNPYIKLTSPQAINDPFLNILIELNWASGRILREYAVLLDPAEANVQNVAAPNVNTVSPAITPKENTRRALDTKQIKDTYGPVTRGDTLSAIARQVLPAGADLNQMLVALYRANRDAFIANNMNLLRVGAVLKIPARNEVVAIDASTARTEIRMQVQDWHNYQGKIAAIRSESPSANISQSDQGKITTSIDKKSATTRESTKEVLRLSSGDQLGKDGQVSESTLVDRLRMMEEDAIARNLALKEANERVALLEKSIENLKHLLELKDSVLAQAQVKAEVVPKIETKPEVHPHPAETIDLLPRNDNQLDINSSQAQERETPVIQPVSETAITENAQPLLPQEGGNESLADQIIGNTEYIGAASILILLVILLIVKKRRNQLNGERGLDGDTDFSSTMQSRMASVAAAAQSMSAAKSDHTFSETEKDDLTYENMNAYPETEEYDYGFDKDSIDGEEHIGQAKKSESETMFISGLPPEYETLIDNSQPNDQSINLNLQEDFSEDHSQLADANEDYGSKGSKDEIDKSVNLQESINASDYELDMDFDDSKYSSASASPEDKALEKDNSIDFEFAHPDINLAEEEPANEVKLSNSTLNDSIPSELTKEVLDFDQSQNPVDNTKKLEVVSHVPMFGLADISLDIEDSNSIDKEDEVRSVNEKSEQWQEIETKLDLAKAYQEMKDKEGAKEMFEEVIRDGDAKQKKAARKLLKSL